MFQSQRRTFLPVFSNAKALLPFFFNANFLFNDFASVWDYTALVVETLVN